MVGKNAIRTGMMEHEANNESDCGLASQTRIANTYRKHVSQTRIASAHRKPNRKPNRGMA